MHQKEAIIMTTKTGLILSMSFVVLLAAVVTGIIFSRSTTQVKETSKAYEEIITDNKGAYIVKNELYTGTSLEFTELEKVMKQIRSECKKPCKINLYSDRKAYELDIMPGEDNFSGFTEEQKSYLRTHVLAFWGIDDGDSIEYYPSK